MATTFLTRTVTSTETPTKLTFSCWVKRSGLGATQRLLSQTNNSTNQMYYRFEAGDTMTFWNQASSATVLSFTTNRVFRDTSGYYNIVFKVDTTQAIEANRVKLFINGVQETSFSSSTYPSLNATLGSWSATDCKIDIGYQRASTNEYFNGLLSHVQLSTGYSYDATSFGEVDATSGIWRIKTGAVANYGSNGCFLKFETTSGSAMGTDSSGEGNNFTESGSPTQAIDNPSNVMCTWNPLNNYFPNQTFSNGNTTCTTPSSGNYFAPSLATMGVSTGKWYWENKFVSTTQSSHKWLGVGVSAMTSVASADYFGKSTYDLCYYSIDDVYQNASVVTSLNTWVAGDIIGVALDATNGLVYFYKNGVVENSGTGFSLTAVGSSPNGVYTPAVGIYDNAEYVCSTNFGNGKFGTTTISSAGTSSTGDDSIWEYDCPTGYYGLNTNNRNTYG